MRQAQANVAGHATSRSAALNPSSSDGEWFRAIEQDGIQSYLPANTNMTLTKDARETARRAVAKAAQCSTLLSRESTLLIGFTARKRTVIGETAQAVWRR